MTHFHAFQIFSLHLHTNIFIIMNNYIVSARKYRPSTFDTVVGQEALTTTLKNSIHTGRLAHAYLFCGPRGVGKTTCARIFAKTINCLSPLPNGEACGECESCKAFSEQRSFNIHELDAASNNSVDDIRQLIDQVMIPPQIGKYKVFIIDEVHMLSAAAFNAFLKTLEEPPKHAIFILATTEKHKLLPTILSRCQIYDFKRMTVDNIVSHLRSVAQQENITAEDAALNVIAQKADGGMRDALSIFDQVASFCNGNITYKQTIANLNVLDYEYYFKITDFCLESKITECMLTLNEILSKGFEGQYFITGLSSHLRNLLVSQDPQTIDLIEANEEVRTRYRQQAQRCKPQLLIKALKLTNQCDLSYKQSQNKRLLIELTLIEMAQLSSDDEASSGPRPAKILKPIFSHLRQLAQPTASAAAASAATASHTATAAAPAASAATPGAPTPAPSMAAITRPAASAAQKPKVAATHFSIKQPVTQASRQQAKEPAAVAITSDEPPLLSASAPIDNVNLTIAWREFAAKLPQEDTAISQQMDFMEPAIEGDGTTFTVIADNPTLLDIFTKMKPRIESYLRLRLQHPDLAMHVRLREVQDRKRVLSKRERYAAMLQESPALRKLQEIFQLELQ